VDNIKKKMYSFYFVWLIPLSIYVYNNISLSKKDINDFNDLKNSVKSVHQEYNEFRLYYETLKLVFYKYKESYLQYKFGIVKNIDGNMYINYYKNHTLYTIVIKNDKNIKVKNKRKNMIVFDETDKDITQEIKRFMGFNYDFHNIELTPKDLGYNKLVFYINDSEEEKEYIFENDEIIKIE
jgi:hypothetical protein